MRTLHERKNKCILYFLFFAGDLRDGVSSCQRYLLRLPSSREAAHDNAVASSLASRAADVRAPDSDTNIEAPRLKIQRLATFFSGLGLTFWSRNLGVRRSGPAQALAGAPEGRAHLAPHSDYYPLVLSGH